MSPENRGEDSKVTVLTGGGPNIVIRALWFLFIGWELTAVWLLVAWLLNLTVIGIPVGIKMINMAPMVLTLKSRRMTKTVTKEGDIDITGPNQLNILVRAVYFILVGWWFSLIWMLVGYLLCLTVIGLPFGVIMLNRLPEATTLYRQK